MVYQCLPVVYRWKLAVTFGITSGIPEVSSAISVVLPVEISGKI